MRHIFISYSRKDEKQVTRFAEGLQKQNFEIWQDIAGKRSGIPYSVKWFEVIEEAVFTACGAIIFESEAWIHSIQCQREFQLIRETALPFLCIPMDRLLLEEASVIREAECWCREQTVSKENNYCSWMRSGAYRVYKKLPIETYFPKGKHIFRNCLWLKECNQLSKQKNFQGAWVENLKSFLCRAKHKLLWDIMGRFFIWAFLFISYLWASTVWEFFQMIRVFNKTVFIEAICVSEIQRIGEYDPIQAIQEIEEYDAEIEAYTQDVKEDGDRFFFLKDQGDVLAGSVSRNYYSQNRVLADFVSRNYPIDFYESIADCPIVLSNINKVQTSSRYTISLSENTSQVFIYDNSQDTTCQLLLSAVPKVYCFNDARDELVIAAANKVYVYDLLGGVRPRLLSYNFENICELHMHENKIYATTENSHVIVWDNPLLERKIHRQNIASGEIVQLADGQFMAVYIDNGCLVKNMDNKEETYPLPFEGVVDQENISVSPDCTYVAVSYKPEGSSSDWIGLIELANGSLKQTYDTKCDIAGYIFSENGNSLIIACYDKNSIAYINLKTGEMQESIAQTYSNPYSIISYESRILVCDTSGTLTVYDSDLELMGDYRRIGYQAPQKQLAVSQKYDCLLTAGRGGNVAAGSCRTSLSSNKQEIFVPIYGESMESTTSVTVTKDGDYAAYGNADGSIYVWDLGVMEQVWNNHQVPEAIINLSFSNDSNMLYALGSSGNIYKMDITDIILKCVPAEPKSIWQMQMGEADEIRKNMYNLRLFFNK